MLNDDEPERFIKDLDAALFEPPTDTVLETIRCIYNAGQSAKCPRVVEALQDNPDISSAGGLDYLGGMVALATEDKRDTSDLIRSLKGAAVRVGRIITSAEFVRGFRPPNYILDGILQRGYLYSLTGQTGSGKTAVALRLMATIAMGRPFGDRETERGHVLMLAGENADDVRARWIALEEQQGFVADEIDAHFMPGVFSIPDAFPAIELRAESVGGLACVVVDTSAAYFRGNEENSNTELGDHARMLRELTHLPGNPCVVVCCHPTKSAANESLLPRGGGAFVNEVDGNLTCFKTDSVIELHWHGKIRGPDFDPMALELVTTYSERLVNAKGIQMPTIIARPLSESEHRAKADAIDHDMQRLVLLMSENPSASIASLAEAGNWTLANGNPHKSKVARLIAALKKQSLVTKELNTWVLSRKGKDAVKRIDK